MYYCSWGLDRCIHRIYQNFLCAILGQIEPMQRVVVVLPNTKIVTSSTPKVALYKVPTSYGIGYFSTLPFPNIARLAYSTVLSYYYVYYHTIIFTSKYTTKYSFPG